MFRAELNVDEVARFRFCIGLRISMPVRVGCPIAISFYGFLIFLRGLKHPAFEYYLDPFVELQQYC